jgi:hypothetical protein
MREMENTVCCSRQIGALSSGDKRNARTIATHEIYAKSILFDSSYREPRALNANVTAAIEFSVNATAVEVAPKRRSVQSYVNFSD